MVVSWPLRGYLLRGHVTSEQGGQRLDAEHGGGDEGELAQRAGGGTERHVQQRRCHEQRGQRGDAFLKRLLPALL